jgi:uncharacterized repeat protein (TIGR01451 family)
VFDTKAWIEANFHAKGDANARYTVQTFTPPTDASSADFRTAAKNAGYIGARGGSATRTFQLPDLTNIYDFQPISNRNAFGRDTEIRKNVDSGLLNSAQNGEIFLIYAHNSTEMSLDQVRQFAEESKSAQSIDYTKTFGEIVNEIRTSGSWVNPDGNSIRWTRSYPDLSDFHLLSLSPAIDAGLDTNLVGDIEGNVPFDDPNIPNTGNAGAFSKNYVDMGTYEFGYVIRTDLVLRASPASILPGGDINYEVQFSNLSQSQVVDINISVPIPGKTSFVDGSADNGGTISNNKVIWPVISNMASGATFTAHFAVRVN